MLEPTPLNGGNADFLDALYEQYLRDPGSVEEPWRSYFAQLVAGATEQPHGAIRKAIAERAASGRSGSGGAASAAKQAAVSRLIQVWINRGHLVANIDPLGLTPPAHPRALEPEYFGLAPVDLATEFFTGSRIEAVPKRMKLRDILAQLQFIYGG